MSLQDTYDDLIADAQALEDNGCYQEANRLYRAAELLLAKLRRSIEARDNRSDDE